MTTGTEPTRGGSGGVGLLPFSLIQPFDSSHDLIISKNFHIL